MSGEVGNERDWGASRDTARCVGVLLATMLLWAVSLALLPSAALAQGSGSEGSGYYVTFAARVCPDYTDIYANRARNDIVESLKDLGPDTQYGDSGALISPVYEDEGGQLNCEPLPGWNFTLGTGYESRAVTGVWGSISKVTGAYGTSILTQSSTPLLDNSGQPIPGDTLAGATTIELTKAERDQANEPDQLWAQGGVPTDPVLAQTYPGPEYGFGTLRCATDNLNGDNVEYIFFPAGVYHVFCYAYYVKPPPTTGLITIQKQVTGIPTGANPAFPFNGNLSFNPDGFQLSNGGSEDFYRAGGSSWTVTEGPVDSYKLASLTCVNASGGPASTWNISGSTVTINLAALSHVTCTFTNQFVPPPAGLQIRKITKGGVGTFSFDVTPVSGGTSRSATATTTEENVPVDAAPSPLTLAPGTYQIVEHSPATAQGHWRRKSVVCNDASRSTTQPLEVTLKSGEVLACVFTNQFTPAGSISIAKVTQGATGTASFLVEPLQGTPAQHLQTATTTAQGVAADATPNTPADSTDHLRLGSYRIIEQSPESTPAGAWALTSVLCGGQVQPFAQGSTDIRLTRTQPAARCVFTDTFTPNPPPEPPPEPPEPLPPEPTPPPGPAPDQPTSTSSDLVVTKSASPPSVVVGGVVTYHITVRNLGPDDATRVVVNDKPTSSGAQLVFSVQTSVGRCQTRLPLICHLGTLKPGARVNITLRLRLTEQTRAFTNRVAVGTATYDPTLANGVAHATVAVVAPPPPVGLG